MGPRAAKTDLLGMERVANPTQGTRLQWACGRKDRDLGRGSMERGGPHGIRCPMGLGNQRGEGGGMRGEGLMRSGWGCHQKMVGPHGSSSVSCFCHAVQPRTHPVSSTPLTIGQCPAGTHLLASVHWPSWGRCIL